MAIHNSVLKRERQNEKNRLINRVSKSQAHTALINLTGAIQNKNKEGAYKCLADFMSIVDKNVKRGIFHKNKASRLKSRLTIRVKKAFNEMKPE